MEKPPRRALLALVAVSLGLTALVPLTNQSPYGDLSAGYTDHLHHAHATWVFLHRGLDAYRLPLDESSRGSVRIPSETGAWPQMPVNYPPGMFAVFLPTALARPVRAHDARRRSAGWASCGCSWSPTWPCSPCSCCSPTWRRGRARWSG